jgi:hypothetical protein
MRRRHRSRRRIELSEQAAAAHQILMQQPVSRRDLHRRDILAGQHHRLTRPPGQIPALCPLHRRQLQLNIGNQTPGEPLITDHVQGPPQLMSTFLNQAILANNGPVPRQMRLPQRPRHRRKLPRPLPAPSLRVHLHAAGRAGRMGITPPQRLRQPASSPRHFQRIT